MSRFSNIKTKVDGIVFHSKAEANRYTVLKSLVARGIVTDLILQPRYDYKLDNKLMFFYKADFKYTINGHEVVEDVKGISTPVFMLKKKLIEHTYGFKIKLVPSSWCKPMGGEHEFNLL